MPLVLTSNEVKIQNVFDWNDITGTQYHYPNGYVNKVQSGESFIYYRGIRRAGNKRGQAEYFGHGIIGDIWRDPNTPEDRPKKNWQWFCSIENYVPFENPVPAKINGEFFENIAKNLWGMGIRTIDVNTYERILQSAGLYGMIEFEDNLVELPPLIEVRPTEGVCFIPKKIKQTIGPSGKQNGRYSKRAKLVGDRAEEIVFEWIKIHYPNAKNIRWMAKEKLTPGWDIQYEDKGQLISVEVKASAGKALVDFEVTQNELDAARKLGANYWFYLVANCLGKKPVIQRLSACELEKSLAIEPVRWRITCSPASKSL